MANFTTPFTTEANYTKSEKIEVVGGLAKLKESFMWNNLVAYWKMDDTSGNLVDHSGNGHTAAATNLSYGNPGKVGTSVGFNGSSSKAVIADHSDFSFTEGGGVDTPFSISLWAYINNTNDQMIINKLNTNREWYFYHSHNKLILYLESDSDNTISATTVNTIPINQWVYITATYNGEKTYDGISIYLNGVLQDLDRFKKGTYTGMSNGTDPIVIGQHGNQRNMLRLNGMIDELAVFKNYALTPSDVEYIYNSGNGKKLLEYQKVNDNILDNLSGHWKMDEVSGNILDSSGNNNDFLNSGASYGATGVLDEALHFDGASNLNAGNKFNLGTGNKTFSLWFKVSTQGDNCLLLAKSIYDAQDHCYALYSSSAGEYIRFYIVFTGNNILDVKTPVAPYEDNNWHHVAVSIDRAGLMSLFIDGKVMSTVDISSKSTEDIQTTNDFLVGAYNNTSGIGAHPTYGYFTGDMDDLMMWDRDLSSSEIQEVYNFGAGKHIEDYGDTSIVKTLGNYDNQVASFTNFVVTKGTVDGLLSYQLSEDGTDWKYWDGSIWSSADKTQRNSEATVNTNIVSFPATAKSIFVKSFLNSNGSQAVEIDEIQIGYSTNTPANVDAGTNKTCKNGDTISPFSDATFSDPNGTVIKAEYKIENEVTNWTEILQGGYGTLQEAVQAFSYQFNNINILTCELRVTDNGLSESTDSVEVTVEPWSVTFNIRDEDGNHLTGVNFTAGDGSPTQTLDSPFIHSYEVGTYNPIFEHAPHTTYVEENFVVNSDTILNVTLFELTPNSIAGAVWSKLTTNDWGDNSFGEAVKEIRVYAKDSADNTQHQ